MGTWIKQNKAPLACICLVVAALALFFARLRWDGLLFHVQLVDFAGLLAPLAFAAAVVERAVEIVISPWRDGRATQRQNAVAAAQKLPDDLPGVTTKAEALKAATDSLAIYRDQTQRYAFAVSLSLGLAVAIAGIRTLQPFVEKASFAGLGKWQHNYFICLDVFMSAALLAGGADGIHAIVNAVTTFFNATADKVSQTQPSD